MAVQNIIPETAGNTEKRDCLWDKVAEELFTPQTLQTVRSGKKKSVIVDYLADRVSVCAYRTYISVFWIRVVACKARGLLGRAADYDKWMLGLWV